MRLHYGIVILFGGMLALGPAGYAGQADQTAPAGQTGQPGQAQTVAAPVPVRDAQAIVLLSQSLARLKSAPAGITDISLTAGASYTAGSDQETGAATLQALGDAQSRVTLNLGSGSRQETRNGPVGAWSGSDGATHAMAGHNCWTDAAWFSPLLILESAAVDPTVSVAFGGQTTLNGQAVDKLTLSRIVPHQSAAITAEIQKLSTVNLYLDASTLLPVAMGFDTHPDRNLRQDIPVEIQYSDYRAVNGALAPFHIQKFIQHSLLLDLRVSGMTVNSGLAASEFALPANLATGGNQ